MQSYLIYDPSTGETIGAGMTPDGTFPQNAIACTPDQASSWQSCAVSNDEIVSVSSAALLQRAQAVQSATLSAACSDAIMSGFSSNALGSTYSYPSTLTDQTNQNTVAQCASGGLLWCETAGSWAFKQHTQSQAQSVVASFSAWLNKCQQQLVGLMNQVNAATSVSAVESITWANPS